MIHHCLYCNDPFTALRKDKHYCSRSCKQMALVKRNKEKLGIDLPHHQKGNTLKGQVDDERANLQKGNTETERATIIAVSRIEKEEQKEVIPIVAAQSFYVPNVKSKWIYRFYEQIDKRGNEFWFNEMPGDEIKKVEWISVHYRCLLDCTLTISNLKVVEWDDLAELGNAFIFLTTTSYYKELPDDYPFTKDISSLRDKLKAFCLETQAEDWIQFRLKSDDKINLMLQRYELANPFAKISFHQLQENFNKQ